MVEMYS